METVTDFDGYFAIDPVAAGTYVVDARADGYADDLDLLRLVMDRLTVEQRQRLIATFPQVTVSSFGAVGTNVVLHRAGVISGRVTVDRGGLAGPVRVAATLVSSAVVGELSSSDSAQRVAFVKEAEVDDRGYYRLRGLPAGAYRLSVDLRQSYLQAHVSRSKVSLVPLRLGVSELTVYAPHTTEQAESKLVSVADGAQIDGADITIPMRSLHAIQGRVQRAGKALPGLAVEVQRIGSPARGMNAITDEEGRFRFDLLPEGTYQIWSNASHPANLSQCNDCERVTVVLGEQDALGIVLNLAKPASEHGSREL